ncbi:MAG: hypothetical protein KAV87_20610 [Desulfobacteraceae bacterium]|nr:hypothetical protein [Desulfobacteraceae bacterium]
MQVRVYIQSEHFPDIKLVEIDENTTVNELKQAAVALLPANVDASELSLFIEDDDDDILTQVTHVKELKNEHGIRIHLHRCKHVEVKMRFGGEIVDHKFHPATTVGRVRQWAGHRLGMQPGDIAEHVLQIEDTNEQPDVDTHIGALTTSSKCSLTFDLVPVHRING